MLGFLLSRLASGLIAVVSVSALVFWLIRTVPTSPALLVLGADAGDAVVAAFEAKYGLDQPIARQYATWIWRALTRFDFGQSYISGRPITTEIAHTLPVTLELIVVSMTLCLLISIPLGTLSAFRPGGILDHAARAIAVIGVSTPGFWLGLVLILILSVRLGWFPPGDLPRISQGIAAHVHSIVLPAFCLAIYYTAIISRMTRSSILEVLSQDYVRTAIAMGLPKPRVRLIYVLRNAMIPIVSVVAMSCGYMFGWAIVVEQVFNIPGVCRALLAAIFSRDYNLVLATVLVITVAFVLLNILADVLYRVLNPRLSW